MASIGTKIATWLFAKEVGKDQFNNKYYQSKNKNAEGKLKRFVIYNGINEPTKVPPLWHSWLHYLSDVIPIVESNYTWQKESVPNLTGTTYSYKQPRHADNNFNRPNVTGDYQAWNPKN
jgi:NADH:ubiquinone oxidoreductase subunit